MNVEEVIAKVRKLINLGTNAGATEAERERAMTQAHKFLARHNLDMSMVEEQGEQTEKRVDDIHTFVSVPWSRQLAQAIGRLYFCNYLYFRKSKSHLYVGKVSNVETAKLMNQYVRENAFKEAARYGRQMGSKKYERAFMEGVADTISRRVTEIIEANRQQKAGTGTSLVLADVYKTEQQANADLISKIYGSTSSKGTRKRSNIDYNAYNQGVKKGESINLNTQIGGTPKRTRLN